MKQIKRIISVLLIIATTISLLTIPSFAGWDVSAGGTGNGGSVGDGKWSSKMQGIRITIITPSGEPAFTFGYNSLLTGVDMLYSTKNTSKVTISMGGCKAIDTFYSFFNTKTAVVDGSDFSALKAGIHENISAFPYFQAAVGIGTGGTSNESYVWRYSAPDPVGAGKKFNELAKTMPVYANGETWQLNGERIRQLLYGSLDQEKMDDDAAMHVMFDIYNKNSGLPIWALTEAGEKALSGYPEYVAAYKQGLNAEKKCLATRLMELGNMAIVVEPIQWAELRNSENSYSGFVLYGTATNIARGIEELVSGGSWYQKAYKKGGYDVSLYKNTRHSMVLTKEIEYAGRTYKVPSQVNNNSYYVLNDECLDSSLGWAMHIYICGSGDKTHTWDSNKYPESTPTTFKEHPAPDPKEDPLTKDKVEQLKEKLHYNIVKFYEQEILKDDGTSEIIHVATYERSENLSRSHGCDVLFFCPV